jgi:branched-chain amino acid transport system permease protein
MRTLKVASLTIVILALASLFPHFVPSLYMYYATLALVGALWTLSLNFFMGYCGQINFGVGAFGYISGYSFALQAKLGVPNLVALLLSLVIVCLVTYAVSIVLARLREVALGLGTLAFSLALNVAVSTSFKGITGGEDGISLNPFTLFGKTMGDLFYFYVCLGAVAFCYAVSLLVINSRVGRAMKAIGQDEIAARSIGIDIPTYFRLGLLLNSLFAGFAAVLYVQWVKWVSPEHFGLNLNILVLLALVVGGWAAL